MNWWVWHAMFWIPHNYLSCTWEIPWTFQIWNGCKMQLSIVRAVWICLIMVSAVVSFRDFSTVTCQSINASRELTTLKTFHRNCSSRKESNLARKVYINQSIFPKKQEHTLYQLNSWSIFWINFLTWAIMHGLW